ncbi:MAG: inositol monophosphatase [Planctomycetia bacterium]|nr:inositol monophosphatase [Planctomycetia bacterium]
MLLIIAASFASLQPGRAKGDSVPDYLTLCQQAARAGGQALLDWMGRFGVREKGPSDLVTEADWASQEAIRAVLLTAFPQHGFISEEGDANFNSAAEYCWVVDPLDGTTNYVRQLPHYSVSVALLQRGRPIVGVVLDPVHDECFTAVESQGARLNGRLIHTSQVQDLSQALVAASFSAKVEAGSTEIDQFIAALLSCQAVRRTGSAALNLCYVAAGRLDAFWAMSTKAWDVAAGVLLVLEAGGVVSRLDGGPFALDLPHPVAGATPELQKRFRILMQNAVRSS